MSWLSSSSNCAGDGCWFDGGLAKGHQGSAPTVAPAQGAGHKLKKWSPHVDLGSSFQSCFGRKTLSCVWFLPEG
eukprot:12934689-Prorocentrum_lima.AAC.1